MADGSLTSVLGKSGFVSGKEVAMESVLPPGESAVVSLIPNGGQSEGWALSENNSYELTGRR